MAVCVCACVCPWAARGAPGTCPRAKWLVYRTLIADRFADADFEPRLPATSYPRRVLDAERIRRSWCETRESRRPLITRVLFFFYVPIDVYE